MTTFEFLPADQVRAKLAPKRWSYSSLKSFRECPFSFYNRYVLDQYPPMPNAFFGNAFHEWVDHLLKGQELDVPKLLEKWHVQDKRAEFDSCMDNARRWIPRHVGAAKFMNEMELHFALVDGQWVHLPGGYEEAKAHPSPYKFMIKCDLVLLLPGDVVVVYDFKSSRDASYFESHIHQMWTYREFLKVLLPAATVKVYLYYPVVHETIPLEDHLVKHYSGKSALTEVVTEIDHIMSNTDWSPTCHQWCKTCSFKPKCPLFALDEPKLG